MEQTMSFLILILNVIAREQSDRSNLRINGDALRLRREDYPPRNDIFNKCIMLWIPILLPPLAIIGKPCRAGFIEVAK